MEETPYVTRDEVRRLLSQTVDAMTESICARIPASPGLPNVTAEQLYDEVARRLKPHMEEAIRKTLAEASRTSHGRHRR